MEKKVKVAVRKPGSKDENDTVSPRLLLEFLKYNQRMSNIAISEKTGIASSSISAHLKGKTTKMHKRNYEALYSLALTHGYTAPVNKVTIYNVLERVAKHLDLESEIDNPDDEDIIFSAAHALGENSDAVLSTGYEELDAFAGDIATFCKEQGLNVHWLLTGLEAKYDPKFFHLLCTYLINKGYSKKDIADKVADKVNDYAYSKGREREMITLGPLIEKILNWSFDTIYMAGDDLYHGFKLLGESEGYFDIQVQPEYPWHSFNVPVVTPYALYSHLNSANADEKLKNILLTAAIDFRAIVAEPPDAFCLLIDSYQDEEYEHDINYWSIDHLVNNYINYGDMCLVQPSAPIKHGDLVLVFVPKERLKMCRYQVIEKKNHTTYHMLTELDINPNPEGDLFTDEEYESEKKKVKMFRISALVRKF